jgi:phage FluMu gp28-like protein
MQRVNGDSLNFAERSRRKGRLWLQVANNVRECSREKLRPPNGDCEAQIADNIGL